MLEDSALKSIADELLKAAEIDEPVSVDKENGQILSLIGSNPIEEADLILDRRSLAGLCLLCTSMKWLATKTKQLRFISTQATDISKRHSERFEKQRRWTLITAEKQSEPDQVFLPLNAETAAYAPFPHLFFIRANEISAFDGVYQSYEELSAKVLRLLHVEIRTHIIFYIQKSMARTFLLDQELNEPDPEVVSLNADLVGFDEELASHFQPTQQNFVTSGLASLLDAYILSLVPNISAMNVAGCSRQQLNILVLQQNLKNIEAEAQLTRSALYFDMFSSGPDAIIAEAKSKGKDLGFTYDEMRALLDLCYSENKRSDRREVAVGAERGLADHQLQLSEFLW
jgi:exocyst complex component 4